MTPQQIAKGVIEKWYGQTPVELSDLIAEVIEEERDRASKLVEHLELALSFAPKGPVPEGLASMFYHTLNYQDEVKLQERIDAAREAIKEFEDK